MFRYHKKELIVCLVIVCLLFLSAGFFAYLIHYNVKKDIHDLSLDFITSDAFELKNILPISDKLGKTYSGSGSAEGVQGYSEFNIFNSNNTDVDYEIYLIKQSTSEKEIVEDYIKIYLTDSNDKPFLEYDLNSVPSYKNLKVLADKPEAKLLYSGVIKAKATNRFRLRMWIADNYYINNFNEVFKCKVGVRIK